jgi:hypothetical protein
MSRLSLSDWLWASSDAAEDSADPETEPDSAQEALTTNKASRLYDVGLPTLQLPAKSRETTGYLPLAAKWTLVDCGPDGVRPRRVLDLLAPDGQKLPTWH